jgi:prepilin-type N-terminal cleavage/methylation domain-containing protein
MKTKHQAFTLVELLTVIAIIGVLASMVLVVLAQIKKNALVKKARLEMADLVTDISAYDSDYGHFPVSPSTQSAGKSDFTFGGVGHDSSGNNSWNPSPLGTPINGSVLTNDEVIASLLDMTNYPNGGPTANMSHLLNPQQHIYLQPHFSGDTKSSGVGTDLVYRDPWGNPYIITMDLNYDESCWDVLYKSPTVSGGGLNGLIQQTDSSNNAVYGCRGKVMIWSAGPDGKIDSNSPANQGVNKDNVLSWK